MINLEDSIYLSKVILKKGVIVLFLVLLFSKCGKNVNYTYGIKKRNSEYIGRNVLNSVKKDSLNDIDIIVSYDTVRIISKSDTIVYFSLNNYCDTNYLYVEINGLEWKRDTLEPINLTIEEDHKSVSYIFPTYSSIYLSLKIKKSSDYFTIIGLNKNKEYRVEIDKDYHQAHIFQINDPNKILCNYFDGQISVR